MAATQARVMPVNSIKSGTVCGAPILRYAESTASHVIAEVPATPPAVSKVSHRVRFTVTRRHPSVNSPAPKIMKPAAVRIAIRVW